MNVNIPKFKLDGTEDPTIINFFKNTTNTSWWNVSSVTQDPPAETHAKRVTLLERDFQIS